MYDLRILERRSLRSSLGGSEGTAFLLHPSLDIRLLQDHAMKFPVHCVSCSQLFDYEEEIHEFLAAFPEHILCHECKKKKEFSEALDQAINSVFDDTQAVE